MYNMFTTPLWTSIVSVLGIYVLHYALDKLHSIHFRTYTLILLLPRNYRPFIVIASIRIELFISICRNRVKN
jgi:hypothetical protein